MCDGKHCNDKRDCARWIMRCDVERCTSYVNFNVKAWAIKCPFYLSIPNKNYPSKEEL